MHKIDPTRLDLAREFKEKPLGPYGAELQKLLKLMRWEPTDDRFFVVQSEHEGPWYLARSTGPKGHEIEIFRARPYRNVTEAHWAVFRKR